MKTLRFPVVSILKNVITLCVITASLAAQDPRTYIIDIPEQLSDISLSQERIFEDINQDGLLDILFINKDVVFLSYQHEDGSFASFKKIPIPLKGAIDFADIFPGGEKEICVMHSQGISCFQKKGTHWDTNPVLLVNSPTIYMDSNSLNLVREKFAIDLNNDHIPELLMLDWQSLRIFFQNSAGTYLFSQKFALKSRSYLEPPGFKLFTNPIEGVIKKARQNLYNKYWPTFVRYMEWTKKIIFEEILIGDVNHDFKLEIVRIKRKNIRTPSQNVARFYEYQIHTLKENKKFSSEPDHTILDPHGVWISPSCTDVCGNGNRDLLKYQIKTEGGLLQRPQIRLELILEPESGDYPTRPIQVLETSDYPLGRDSLADVNGDGIKELILIHPVTKGFSMGSIIRKYIEKNVEIELRILPFRKGKGFTRSRMITKKMKISFFAGVPTSLAGDFNGDGGKDIMVINNGKLIIYSLNKRKNRFMKLHSLDIKRLLSYTYDIIDLNNDKISEVVFYHPDKINIICITHNIKTRFTE